MPILRAWKQVMHLFSNMLSPLLNTYTTNPFGIATESTIVGSVYAEPVIFDLNRHLMGSGYAES
jgi:hypothetical protein